MYTSSDAANSASDNYAATVSCGVLNNGTSVIIAGLESTSTLYFAYEDGDYVYVASATAGALKAGTAKLEFEQKEKPLVMSAELIGEQYYGVGKTVTLTLTTNKPGTYNVTFNEVNTVSANNPYSKTEKIVVAEGTEIVTKTYITQDWSGAISATVTPLTGNPLTVPGDTRNVLKILAKVYSNNIANNYLTNTTTVNIKSQNSNRQGTTYGTITGLQLKEGTGEITYTGLSSSTEMYFRFTYYDYTAYAQISAENATGSGTLTFNWKN